MMFNPRYGTVGTIAMPYFAIFEFLSPVFSLLGLALTIVLFAIGQISTLYFAAFLTAALGLGVMLTLAALGLEELAHHRYHRRREVWRLIGYAVVENIGFRQLHDAWRAMGYVDIARRKTGWGAQQRRGFATTEVDVGQP